MLYARRTHSLLVGAARGRGLVCGRGQGKGASHDGDQYPAGAPWCVSTWGADGGLGDNYPLELGAFQRALGVPLQLYAPYFCPDNDYLVVAAPAADADAEEEEEGDHHDGRDGRDASVLTSASASASAAAGGGGGGEAKWPGVSSDTSLPGCADFAFANVAPAASRAFYEWFFAKGAAVGMTSFEPDFMNQVCRSVVPRRHRGSSRAAALRPSTRRRTMARHAAARALGAREEKRLSEKKQPSVRPPRSPPPAWLRCAPTLRENYNCVPSFVRSVENARAWQRGMADAAAAAGVAVQWCYATPSDVLASLEVHDRARTKRACRWRTPPPAARRAPRRRPHARSVSFLSARREGSPPQTVPTARAPVTVGAGSCSIARSCPR